MQGIVNWIYYIISVIFCFVIYSYIYSKLSDHKLKINRKYFIIMLIASILILINNIYNNLWIKFLCLPIVLCLSFKFLFNDNLKKIVAAYTLMFLMIILVEFLFTNCLNMIGKLENYDTVVSLTFTKVLLSFLVDVTVCVIFSINRINKKIKKLIQILIDSINIMNIIYMLYFTVVILSILNVVNFSSKNSIKLLLLLLSIFVFLFALIIYLKSKEKVLTITNEKLICFNDSYSKFLDEYKIYKHNINHKLSAMKPFGNKKINALIDELLNEENNFDIKNNHLYNVPTGIKGIVAEKLYNVNIEVIINNKIKNDPFKKLSSKVFHSVAECLGIALDNAIEACKEIENPIIIMDLIEEKEWITIKIGNNFSNNINLEKLGEKYYSTKNRGSGLGLFSIMRNSLVKEKISIINNFYYIELQIKKAR